MQLAIRIKPRWMPEFIWHAIVNRVVIPTDALSPDLSARLRQQFLDTTSELARAANEKRQ